MQNPPPEAQIVQVKAHWLNNTAGGKLRFVTSDGGYIGSIEYDHMTPQALSAMANAFQAWVAQQTSGIQISNGAGIAGLRS